MLLPHLTLPLLRSPRGIIFKLKKRSKKTPKKALKIDAEHTAYSWSFVSGYRISSVANVGLLSQCHTECFCVTIRCLFRGMP